jgi:hypothetical protein
MRQDRDSFATVFRQTVMTRFEQKAYAARVQGRLNGEQLGRLWLEANAPYYGDTLAMTSGYELGWSYIPHFISTPFYCYAYSFGELLVQALYGMYRREGETFVGRYAAFLATGGSQSPSEQVSSMASTWAIRIFCVGFDELSGEWRMPKLRALGPLAERVRDGGSGAKAALIRENDNKHKLID